MAWSLYKIEDSSSFLQQRRYIVDKIFNYQESHIFLKINWMSDIK